MKRFEHEYYASMVKQVQLRERTISITDGIEWDVVREGWFQTIYLAGTDSLSGMLKGLDFRPARTSRGNVWNGYARGASKLFPAVAARLKKCLQIRVVGHSMEAAIGRRLAHLLNDKGYEVVEIVTFGEPAAFGRNYRHPPIPSTRYVCGSDIVPRIPLYAHYGDSHRVRSSHSPPNPLKWLLDHKIQSYAG